MKNEKKKKESDVAEEISADIPVENAEEVAKEQPDEATTLKKQAAEANDKYLRCLAEFDNFRKRTDKEKATMFSAGAVAVAAVLLPVLDNFERALKSPPEAGEDDPFYKGVEIIFNQMKAAFENLGVKEIEAVGKPFDTNLHEAVMHVEDENFGENEVVDELQKGYIYNDKVIRHSMVKVAN